MPPRTTPGKSDDSSRPARLLLVLAALKFFFHLATSSGYGIFRDELYYLACTEHLAFGYVDHPPLSILLLWLSRAILGESLIAIRFLPALAGALLVYLSGRITRELGGDRNAQMIAAVAVFLAPVYLAMGHFYSMNVFDLCFWALLQLLAIRILKGSDAREWLAFGMAAGLGMQNKYSVAFLLFGLAVGLLLTQRRIFLNPWLWWSGLVGLVLFTPHLIWETEQGWPTLEFIINANQTKNIRLGIGEFMLGQLMLIGPLAAPLWIAGLVALLGSSMLKPFRALGWAYLATLGLFLIQHAKVYYLAPIYPVLLSAGAVVFANACRERSWRFAPAIAIAMLALSGALILPMAVPVLPVKSFLRYSEALGIEEPRMEKGERGKLPQSYGDMHGWEEMTARVAEVYRALPNQERRHTAILAGNYGQAGAIDFFGPALGLPKAIGLHNNYVLWGTREFSGDTVIAVGIPEGDLAPVFESLEIAGRITCEYCRPTENDLTILLGRGLEIPLSELQQKLARLF